MNDTCPHCLETLLGPAPTVQGLSGDVHEDCALCCGNPCRHVVATIESARARVASDELRAAIADAFEPTGTRSVVVPDVVDGSDPIPWVRALDAGLRKLEAENANLLRVIRQARSALLLEDEDNVLARDEDAVRAIDHLLPTVCAHPAARIVNILGAGVRHDWCADCGAIRDRMSAEQQWRRPFR